MGKFEDKAALANRAGIDNRQSQNPAEVAPVPDGSMPAVSGPDVRQILGMTGLGAIANKLTSLQTAMSPMLGRLQVAGKGANYLLA